MLSRLSDRAYKMDTSYLAQQVNTIIGQLHGLFDEIGVSNHDRDAREEEVRANLLQRKICGAFFFFYIY